MKEGNRKFIGFLVTSVLYTIVMIVVIFKMPQLVVDLAVFALQASFGYCGIAALFFTSNVIEHFTKNKSAAKNVMLLLIISVALFSLTGCTHTKDITEIKPRVITPPVIEGTIKADLTDSSYNIKAIELIKDAKVGIAKSDTAKYILFRPNPLLNPCIDQVRELQKKNKALGLELSSIGEFYFNMKPDSIVLWDTVKTTQYIKEKVETPFLAKAGLVLIGIILGAAGLYFIRK
jgi:hypothetical protein